MSLFFQVLASGSKGNSILVCSSKTRVLVDAGLSCKELVARLSKTPVQAAQLHALLITHEHSDHVNGAGTLSRRFDLPVFMTRGTLDNLNPKIALNGATVFETGKTFEIGDLRILPFAISHDAGEPTGFIIENEGRRVGICTDLGVATNLVKVRLKDCHALVLEANHDVDKLLNGPYPWVLKQRIKSPHGHLSNEEACQLLEAVHHEKLQCVVFAHLSETNNHPDLVRESSRRLRRYPQWQSVRFELGKQDDLSPGIEVK
ncbi:MAG: MBL fold metallo-hydrolase [Syntrophobacteraceae bacterium]